jgi:hypothetical protein
MVILIFYLDNYFYVYDLFEGPTVRLGLGIQTGTFPNGDILLVVKYRDSYDEILIL